MKYIFGYRGDFKNNVYQHQDPNKVIYPGGHNIVVFNTENKHQQFWPGQPGTQKITCISLSPSKRYLAWSEQTDATGLIIIQDLNGSKRKILSSVEAGSTHYISLQFNPKEEHKQLVSLSVHTYLSSREDLISHLFSGIGINANLLLASKSLPHLLISTKYSFLNSGFLLSKRR